MKHLSAYHQPEGGNTEVSFVLMLHIFIDMIIVIILVPIFVLLCYDDYFLEPGDQRCKLHPLGTDPNTNPEVNIQDSFIHIVVVL